jgi:methylglyoxal synthase
MQMVELAPAEPMGLSEEEDVGVGAAQALVRDEPGSQAIALIAHDHKKAQLVDFAICHRDILREMVGLDVECMRAGRDGGDRQIAECVLGRQVSTVIFLIDPFTKRQHEPDVEPVLKACNLWDIPIATNVATASAVMASIAVIDAYGSRGGTRIDEK